MNTVSQVSLKYKCDTCGAQNEVFDAQRNMGVKCSGCERIFQPDWIIKLSGETPQNVKDAGEVANRPNRSNGGKRKPVSEETRQKMREAHAKRRAAAKAKP